MISLIDTDLPVRTFQKHYPVTVKKEWVESRYTLIATWTSPLTGKKITTRLYDDGTMYPATMLSLNQPVIENGIPPGPEA